MSNTSISQDTSLHVHTLMVTRFASMTVEERAKAFEELNEMCTMLATAGIRAQNGELTPDDLRWHLASRRYGESVADEVYGPR